VVADDTGRNPAASTTKLRLRWLAVVVAIMALLTAGWPLLNMTVSDKHPLAAGSRLTVGPGPGSSGIVTVGSGWSLLQAESNPMQDYLIRRGRLELSITHVALVNREQVPQLWEGLRQTLSLSDPRVRLGRPVLITSGHRLRAITGVASSLRMIGSATIYPGPSRQFAIEMVVMAPRGTSAALRAAAAGVIASLRFTMSPP
jgi:hypothetical protein